MIILPARLYLTAAEYFLNGSYTVGSGDVTEDWNEAYDQYAEARHNGNRVRTFLIELHPDSNAPERITEVTEKMEAEYASICEARGLTMEAQE